MFRRLTAVLVGLLALSTAIDGNIKESLNMRIYNPDFKVTFVEMLKMLEKADLEGHGFQREEARTLLSTGKASNQTVYKTTLYYYKVVDCSHVLKVVMQLEKLLPGALGFSVDNLLVKEMKERKIDAMKKCKAGVEIHFHPNTKNVSQFRVGRFKRDVAGHCCCCCKVESEV